LEDIMATRPPILRAGDTVGIVTLGSPPDAGTIDVGIQTLESMGFNVLVGEHAYSNAGIVAASAMERASDLMNMFENPEVRAIIPTRGGTGVADIIPYLDYDVIRSNLEKGLNILTSNTDFISAIGEEDSSTTGYSYIMFDFKNENIGSNLTITNTEGVVIASTGHNSGQTLFNNPLIKEALAGSGGSNIERIFPEYFSLNVVKPINFDGNIIGVLIADYNLENLDFVDGIKNYVNSEITIFENDLRVNTTIIQDGRRLIGTKLDPKVAEIVINNKQEYIGKADILGQPYITVDRYLYLGGVKQGQAIDGSVTLLAQRNFNVTDTEYYLVDRATGNETLLHKAAYGSYTWFPGPEDAGSKDLYVKVTDTAGITHVSDRVTVNVTGNPKLLLQGIGPGQVLTEAISLNIKTNVDLDTIRYILTNARTGWEIVISEKSTAVIIPEEGDDGPWTVRAQGSYGGKTIKSEEVRFSIYTGPLYSAKPVIEKDKYQDLVSGLAVETRKTTGMSAALQVAQAILETGWGQSVPVDKYDGKFSYNLFGIKGEGTKGSVTSNTWEEYNGVAFRIDAEFRAYNNVKESWQDHKDLLLLRDRYAPFREVMYDSTKGAWELKRCGYATDSLYAVKLINIINRYGLKELDEVTI
jgi:hypothetical protein